MARSSRDQSWCCSGGSSSAVSAGPEALASGGEVVVSRGKIKDVRVTQMKDKQFYSALTDVPQQIVARQSVEGIDAFSGATVTSQAIVNATAKALSRGMK